MLWYKVDDTLELLSSSWFRGDASSSTTTTSLRYSTRRIAIIQSISTEEGWVNVTREDDLKLCDYCSNNSI
jgi:hypothetical protein